MYSLVKWFRKSLLVAFNFPSALPISQFFYILNKTLEILINLLHWQKTTEYISKLIFWKEFLRTKALCKLWTLRVHNSCFMRDGSKVGSEVRKCKGWEIRGGRDFFYYQWRLLLFPPHNFILWISRSWFGSHEAPHAVFRCFSLLNSLFGIRMYCFIELANK